MQTAHALESTAQSSQEVVAALLHMPSDNKFLNKQQRKQPGQTSSFLSGPLPFFQEFSQGSNQPQE